MTRLSTPISRKKSSNKAFGKNGKQSMIFLAGGTFIMGSDRFYPEERPSRQVQVSPFWIDETPVTNAQFFRFVEETGHITLAEKAPDPKDYPGLLPEFAHPGSLLFAPVAGSTLFDDGSWWSFSVGACWKSPLGPDSSTLGLEEHPVVHIAWEDAAAYAKWAGKALPTEAEWEFAARGGLDGADYAWGDQLAPDGQMLANYWQGPFPHGNSLEDGWEKTSPVRTYPANGYGIYDMIGNVWEWTSDWYALPKTERKTRGSCCVPSNPRGGLRGESISVADGVSIPRKVLKGGSHLCAESYCQRYRPAARHPQNIDSSTSHIGFRCISRKSPT